MIDPASVAAVDAATHGNEASSLYGTYCFDAIPQTIRRLLLGESGGLPDSAVIDAAGAARKVVLVWIDAFGWRFAERQAGHPFMQRVERAGLLAKLTSQFPSTTTAHATTLGSGLPVALHGMYEWYHYEPMVGRVICPLMHAIAGEEAGTLHVPGAALLPLPSFSAELKAAGVALTAVMPGAIIESPFTQWETEGAVRMPLDSRADAIAAVMAIRSMPPPSFGFVYLPEFDYVAHHEGPDSEAATAAAVRCLDVCEGLAGAIAGTGTTLLVTADHGMVLQDVDDTVYLDRSIPELLPLLETGADGRALPLAGSSRDGFLHVRSEHVDSAIGLLRSALHPDTRVVRTAELLAAGVFGPDVGQRLRERVGSVTILPPPSQPVSWFGADGSYASRLVAQHGGRLPDEVHIPFASLVL